MKRSLSPSPLPTRKSARISEDISALRELTFGIEHGEHIIDIAPAEISLETYNKFLPFAQPYVRGRYSKLRSCRAEIVEVVEEIEDLIQSTREAFQKKYQTLRQRTQHFANVTMEMPEVYNHGDLLSLSLEELEIALLDMPIASIDKFVSRVHTIITEAMSKRRTFDEEFCSGNNKFLPKAFALCQKMLDLGLHREVVHTLVLLKGLYRSEHQRLWGAGIQDGNNKIEKTMFGLVMQHRAPKEAQVEIETISRDKGERCFIVTTPGLYWTYTNRDTNPSFWDFAAATRSLRAVYNEIKCLGQASEYGVWASNKVSPCFHQNQLNFLEWLQKKALSEIRTKILLTAGTLLPAEITERILEYSLELEDMPSDPCVTEVIMVEPAEWKIRGRQRRNLPSPAARAVRSTKDIYRCSKMRRPWAPRWECETESDREDIMLT